MSIDPRYVSCADLQEYINDKSSGLPLAGGYVYFYQDDSRTNLQNVYELTGDAPNYSFSPLPNPVRLSPTGTFMDNDGNDVVPYYLPFLVVDGAITETPSLYYVVVQASDFTPQFTREAWPPNSYVASSSPGGVQTDFNYIPNGQFLAHNNLPGDGTVTEATTILGQGGWVFRVKDSLSSTNEILFNPVGSWTDDPPQSPRFEINVVCTVPNSSEVYKSLSIDFSDVNKFANGESYSFGFWGVSLAGDVDVTINVNKNFGVGGSSFVPVEQGIVTITPVGQFFSIPINFGDNAGETIGTGDTYVSIDLSFSTAVAFNLAFTDFVLLAGSIVISDFPAQTDADMLTRGVAGWMNIPDPNGQDLYLPLVLTPSGMVFDHSSIGNIEQSVAAVANPNDALTANPAPIGNLMPCNVGDSYLFDDFSTLGIPFSRLGNFLIERSPIANTPMFGTGLNFATMYAQAYSTATMRLTVNSSGTGVSYASAVTTPPDWVFTGIPVYNGSTTGSASLNYVAYNNVADTVLAVANFATPNLSAGDGTSPFTVTELNNQDGIIAQQFYGFTVLCTNGASLVTGGNCLYFAFSNATTNFAMQFQTGTETPITVIGKQTILVNISASASAQDVANIVRETINAYQSTNILVTGATFPSEGAYFNFQANPASPTNYFVWYSYAEDSVPPNVPGRVGIKVLLPNTSPTAPQIVTATLTAINKYQYAPPPFNQGMFLRAIDFNGIYDKDVAQRWSSISGLSGANYGTFEYQQVLTHVHILANSDEVGSTSEIQPGQYLVGNRNAAGYGDYYLAGNTTVPTLGITGYTGGAETRPVNAYVNLCIRY